MLHKNKICTSALILGTALVSHIAFASCPAGYPTHTQLQTALRSAVGTTADGSGAINSSFNGGFGLHMWATIVTRGGVVCDVAYSAPNGQVGAQWPGSRVISAQKANTANAFSLPGLALSTANLYSATQPGGSLFGLQESNPINVAAAYYGAFASFGTSIDPMIDYRIGGVNVFGGGLALYNAAGTLIGGMGVSGDSSCADHNIAWRTRHSLGLDHVPNGVSSLNGIARNDDNIVYDIANGDTTDLANIPALGKSTSGWGHPQCSAAATTVANAFKKAGSTAATAAP